MRKLDFLICINQWRTVYALLVIGYCAIDFTQNNEVTHKEIGEDLDGGGGVDMDKGGQ
jgi:hypothetical protein